MHDGPPRTAPNVCPVRAQRRRPIAIGHFPTSVPAYYTACLRPAEKQRLPAALIQSDDLFLFLALCFGQWSGKAGKTSLAWRYGWRLHYREFWTARRGSNQAMSRTHMHSVVACSVSCLSLFLSPVPSAAGVSCEDRAPASPSVRVR